MLSAQPEDRGEINRQDTPSFKRGIEIPSRNFIVRLSTFSSQNEAPISYEIYRASANGKRVGLQCAGSECFTELIDCLEIVERQIKRDGIETNPQSLGRRVGVKIWHRSNVATGEDVSTAQLLIEADGHWREHLGHPFDAALIPELVRLTNEVLSLMREKALPAKSGLGFRFSVE